MKKLLFILLVPFFNYGQTLKIQPYVDYLNKIEKKSAKEYILQQFQAHDIVILCERDHSEFSQYELIKEILSDDYFKTNVKNVFTEIGVVNLQPEITKFLKTKSPDSSYVLKKLIEFQRNAEMYPIWERYNYHFLLKSIYEINNESENQISYYPSDSKFDWKTVNTIPDYKRLYEIEVEPRDSLLAHNIIDRYEKIKSHDKEPKALIILNFRHAFKQHTLNSKGETIKNAGKYLSDYFGNRAISILSNRPIFRRVEGKWDYRLMQNGKWDAAFKYLNIDDMGFDLKNSVFGNAPFDLLPNMSATAYSDIFDGFVFYESIEQHTLIDYYHGLISKDFEQEFFRRFIIQQEYLENHSILEKLRDSRFKNSLIEELNTRRVRKYQNLEDLLSARDEYLSN